MIYRPGRELGEDSCVVLSSFSVQRCTGSQKGCMPCTWAASKAFIGIGLQACVLTSSIIHVDLLTKNSTCLIMMLISLYVLSLIRVHISRMETLVTVCRFVQAISTLIAAGVWVAGHIIKKEQLLIVVTVCILFVFISGAQISLFYVICAANGTGTHFRASLLAIISGCLLGASAKLVEINNKDVPVGLGIAIAIITSCANFGLNLRDTCHYRIGRYACMRTFTDLGRGVNYTWITNAGAEPKIEEVAEEKVSLFKFFKELPGVIFSPAVGTHATPIIWIVLRLGYGLSNVWQTPAYVVFCLTVGHVSAMFLEQLIVRINYTAEASSGIHATAHAVCVVLAAFGYWVAAPISLAFTTSGGVLGALYLRKRATGASRLAATHISRWLIVSVYVAAGLCYATIITH
ncbi:envelope protein UL43 [Equid alphaherpesvirus 4]|nr:envelope protein UL43 [Equid alphaherpesvirus 4]AAC59531.1 17 [Equid alphaherpesvirus 4]AMB15900.1 envelope protein UL43 [Equid alphaherpesvirus 4]AMB15979.1 envelope protein UL43 [Equid alphaherpesvirus 4]AMB16058.1 envelope protein UL43 [Equid alphaherpesvirus 4]AMB16137.1 envelope protein UL43 [Equid alphaherpesvirus 4]